MPPRWNLDCFGYFFFCFPYQDGRQFAFLKLVGAKFAHEKGRNAKPTASSPQDLSPHGFPLAVQRWDKGRMNGKEGGKETAVNRLWTCLCFQSCWTRVKTPMMMLLFYKFDRPYDFEAIRIFPFFVGSSNKVEQQTDESQEREVFAVGCRTGLQAEVKGEWQWESFLLYSISGLHTLLRRRLHSHVFFTSWP